MEKETVTLTVPKQCDGWATKHFRYREYDCPCSSCDETLIYGELSVKLERLRELAGVPVTVTSGYRCPSHQLELKKLGYETAVGISSHELGMAADVSINGMFGQEMTALAEEVGFTNIGVGKRFIHVDVRPGTRRWSYHAR